MLFTRTSAAIQTRDLRSIADELERAGVATFQTRIVERAAYRSLFSYGGTLATLDPAKVSGIPAAIQNARAFAEETVVLLEYPTPIREVA